MGAACGSRRRVTASLSPPLPAQGVPAGRGGVCPLRGIDTNQVLVQPERWRRGALLGEGAHGKVYMAMNEETGSLVAVKEVSLVGPGAEARAGTLEDEIRTLSQLHHPNVVSYLGTERSDTMLHIFLEYMPCGSIAGLLAKFGALEEAVVARYMIDILAGLGYLHDNGVIHCDIKGSNLLVDACSRVKVADFGTAQPAAAGADSGSGVDVLIGTPQYLAPEVIAHPSRFSKKSDVWAVGCTVIEMLTARVPWSDVGNAVAAMYAVADTKKHPPIPDTVSDAGRAFLGRCFEVLPKARDSVQALQSHSFVANVAVPRPSVSTPPSVLPAASFLDSMQSMAFSHQRRLSVDSQHSQSHDTLVDSRGRSVPQVISTTTRSFNSGSPHSVNPSPRSGLVGEAPFSHQRAPSSDWIASITSSPSLSALDPRSAVLEAGSRHTRSFIRPSRSRRQPSIGKEYVYSSPLGSQLFHTDEGEPTRSPRTPVSAGAGASNVFIPSADDSLNHASSFSGLRIDTSTDASSLPRAILVNDSTGVSSRSRDASPTSPFAHVHRRRDPAARRRFSASVTGRLDIVNEISS